LQQNIQNPTPITSVPAVPILVCVVVLFFEIYSCGFGNLFLFVMASTEMCFR